MDPGFVGYDPAVDPRDWDLRLAEDSALINAGDPSIVQSDGTVSDVGAYGGE